MKCYYCEKECEGFAFEQGDFSVFAHRNCAVEQLETHGELTKVSVKMDIEKAKKQFELVKDTETFIITTITFQSLLEEVEDQTKWADTYFKELQEAKKEIEELKQEKKYWIDSHNNHQKAVDALKEIAIYKDDFYGNDMAEIAIKALKGLI